MEQEMIKILSSVVVALNDISVSGMKNMLNLTGSIRLVEEVITALGKLDVSPKTPETQGKE